MTTGLLSPAHIGIVLIIALLVLGTKRLPQTLGAVGRGMHEFREGIRGRDETAAASHQHVPLTAPVTAAAEPAVAHPASATTRAAQQPTEAAATLTPHASAAVEP